MNSRLICELRIPAGVAVFLEPRAGAVARSHLRNGLGTRVSRVHADHRQPRVALEACTDDRAGQSLPLAAGVQERLSAVASLRRHRR